MPVDILNFRAEDGAVDGCALTENAKELKMDDDEDKDKDKEEEFSNEVTMRRLRRASKMAVNMLNSDLTPSQQNIVDGAINGSGPLHEVLANSNGNQVQRRSMQRLRPEVWLNDEVVNYFLKVCLASRDKNMHNDNTNHRRSHFFTSFFVQNLFDEKNGNANEKGKYKYSNVKRWHKYAPGKNIFEVERIFFPININNTHWALVVAFMDEKRIQYYDYDSLKRNGTRYLDGIFQYLQDDYKRQFKSDMDTSEWRLVLCTEDTPQQDKYNKDNGWDCGVFVCLFADFIAMDCAPIFNYDEASINKCRDRIALSIMDNCAIDRHLTG